MSTRQFLSFHGYVEAQEYFFRNNFSCVLNLAVTRNKFINSFIYIFDTRKTINLRVTMMEHIWWYICSSSNVRNAYYFLDQIKLFANEIAIITYMYYFSKLLVSRKIPDTESVLPLYLVHIKLMKNNVRWNALHDMCGLIFHRSVKVMLWWLFLHPIKCCFSN